jgi:hypothetical protein
MNNETFYDTLDTLLGIRGVGQTSIAANSVRWNNTAMLVVGNYTMKTAISHAHHIPSDRILTIADVGKLRGMRKPLVWDTTAVVQILQMASKTEAELRALKKEVAVNIIMKEKTAALTEAVDDLLDEDGYPTEYTLNKIRTWSPADGWNELMEFIKPMWTYMFETEYMSGGKTEYTLATGGWSGNEDIVSALHRNYMFWGLCWNESLRGGQYVFVVDNNYPT